MANRTEGAECVAMVSAAWPSAPFPDSTIRLWISFIEPYDVDSCRRAILEFIRTARAFPPTIGAIIERVAELELERKGVALLGAAEAFEEVERKLDICGIYGTPVFENPVVQRTVNLIGLEEIRTTSERGVIRGQFKAAYLEFREAELRQAVETLASGNALPGPTERQKLLSDQRAADRLEGRKIERDFYVDQQARLYGISREEAAEFLQSGLDYREFYLRKALPAPSEGAVN